MRKSFFIERLGFPLSLFLTNYTLRILVSIFGNKRDYLKFLYKLTRSYDCKRVSTDVKRIMLPLLTRKENSIYFDRIMEFCQFFDVGYIELNKIITRFGVPDQPVFRKNIFKGF